MDDIRTERLRWRLPRADDFGAFLSLVSDYEVVKWTASWPHPPDPELVRRRCEPVPPEQGFAGLIWHEGACIGAMGIVEAEIGFALARAHWGRGFASEMAAAMIARAFQRYDWPQIAAGVFAGNAASMRVLEKRGFVETGQGTHANAAQGATLPITRYALTRAAWLAANPLSLETARLVIRPYIPADAPAFRAIANHASVARMMTSVPHPMSEAQAADWIAARAWTGRPGFCLGVWLKDGPLIGNLGLGGAPLSTMYFFGPRHWRRGYATEAMRAFLGWAFPAFGLAEIAAGAMADNPASARVLEKLGFARAGTATCKSPARLEEVPQYLYRLSRTRFEAAR